MAVGGTAAAVLSNEFTDNEVHKQVNNTIAGAGELTGFAANSLATVLTGVSPRTSSSSSSNSNSNSQKSNSSSNVSNNSNNSSIDSRKEKSS